jgi:hypothetical protein
LIALRVLIPLVALVAVASVVARATRNPVHRPARKLPPLDTSGLARAAARIDAHLASLWKKHGLAPAPPASDLGVLRRLSLALHGTVPSLEEIRQFEADAAAHRPERWTQRMLADRRFADYFAQRLVRAFVGSNEGPFLVYRKDRFASWLADQLARDEPFDSIVRRVISDRGLWTGQPSVNFITATIADDRIDRMKLAGRTVRAFLGQRMDCAQCHDHPFASWKQSQFEGLAAFYAEVGNSLVGIQDGGGTLEVEDPKTKAKRTVAPRVPFQPELVPATGSLRERLAGWVTHPRNRRFGRAVANRVWGTLFGRPCVTPVDDLSDPPAGPGTPGGGAGASGAGPAAAGTLDLLAAELAAGGWRLKRLIQVITMTAPFRLESAPAAPVDARTLDRMQAHWAIHPLVRLRPEQVIGSILQAGSIKTIDSSSHLLQRVIRFLREADFVKEYGDFVEDELIERGGTIPQRLLLLNGKLVREITEPHFMSAPGRVAGMAVDDAECVQTSFLICLTRRPTPQEQAHYMRALAGTTGNERGRKVEDLFWGLINATEFSWNH